MTDARTERGSGAWRRRLVVCADDAGWDRDNDEVIHRLAAAGGLSAISVLVDGPSAPDWAARDLPAGCSLGLHLNLTWTPDGGSTRLGRLLLAACTRRLPVAATRERIVAQLRRYERLYGGPPAFVDGHQHVHALPVVRELLLAALTRRYGASGSLPAVRSTQSRHWRGAKPLVLNRLGGRALARRLQGLRWACNQDFAGVYDFSPSTPYRARMQAWLSTLGDGGLVMAHPGVGTLAEHGAARAREASYLASPHWQTDRTAAGFDLVRFDSAALAAQGGG
jgi:chitin disaccharide deacetylase